MRRTILAAGLLAAGCALTTPEETAPTVNPSAPAAGYPPVMGEIVAQMAGQAVSWQTYDFSVGAFDASAWMSEDQGMVALRLIGYTPGSPDLLENRLSLTARFDALPRPGELAAFALVEVVAGSDFDGPRLTSAGGVASIAVETITRDGSYGRLGGSFSAEICATDGDASATDRGRCVPIAGRFDTSVQFDNM